MSPSEVLEMLGGSHYVMAGSVPGTVRIAVTGPWLKETMTYTAAGLDTALMFAAADAESMSAEPRLEPIGSGLSLEPLSPTPWAGARE